MVYGLLESPPFLFVNRVHCTYDFIWNFNFNLREALHLCRLLFIVLQIRTVISMMYEYNTRTMYEYLLHILYCITARCNKPSGCQFRRNGVHIALCRYDTGALNYSNKCLDFLLSIRGPKYHFTLSFTKITVMFYERVKAFVDVRSRGRLTLFPQTARKL